MQSITVASKLELIKGSAMNAAAIIAHHETQSISKFYPTLKKKGGENSLCVCLVATGTCHRADLMQPGTALMGGSGISNFQKLAV